MPINGIKKNSINLKLYKLHDSYDKHEFRKVGRIWDNGSEYKYRLAMCACGALAADESLGRNKDAIGIVLGFNTQSICDSVARHVNRYFIIGRAGEAMLVSPKGIRYAIK